MSTKKSPSDEPEVTIFGEDVDKRHHHSDSVVWGVLVLLAGVIFLLNTLSLVPWSIWNEFFRYWPVLLIVGGLHIVVGNSLVARIVMAVVSFIVFGTVVLLVFSSVAPNILNMLPFEVWKYIFTVKGYLHL